MYQPFCYSLFIVKFAPVKEKDEYLWAPVKSEKKNKDSN